MLQHVTLSLTLTHSGERLNFRNFRWTKQIKCYLAKFCQNDTACSKQILQNNISSLLVHLKFHNVPFWENASKCILQCRPCEGHVVWAMTVNHRSYHSQHWRPLVGHLKLFDTTETIWVGGHTPPLSLPAGRKTKQLEVIKPLDRKKKQELLHWITLGYCPCMTSSIWCWHFSFAFLAFENLFKTVSTRMYF